MPTKTEFQEILIRLNPANKFALEGSVAMPMIATMTAAHCFTHGIEGPDADALRHQLLSLETSSCFDFSSWEE